MTRVASRDWIGRALVAAGLLLASRACLPDYIVVEDDSGNASAAGSGTSSTVGGGTTTGGGGSGGANDICGAGGQAPGTHLFSKRFGDAENQEVRDLVADADGNVLITGKFVGTADFGGSPLFSAGDADLFLAKLDCAGNLSWSKRFGDGGGQSGTNRMAIDKDGNVLLAGLLAGVVDFGGGALAPLGGYDVFVAKFSATGQHLWSKRFGDGKEQMARGVAVDSTGNVVIVGDFEGALDFGGPSLLAGGGADIFLAKLDPAGAHLWSKSFAGSGTDTGGAVHVDAADDILLTGDFTLQLSLGGATFTSAGDKDMFVAKLDSSGGHTWSKPFGSKTNTAEIGARILADSDRNVVVAGAIGGGVDFGGGEVPSDISGGVVVKLDTNGKHVESRRFGKVTCCHSLAVHPNGDILFGGAFTAELDVGVGSIVSAASSGLFFVALSPELTPLWSGATTGIDAASTNGVAFATAGNIFVTGNFFGTVNVGGGPLTSNGERDILLAKFAR